LILGGMGGLEGLTILLSDFSAELYAETSKGSHRREMSHIRLK